MVYFRVLGPLAAEVDGAVADLGGPRQRAVLAVLLAARGQVVSVDRLIEDLWRTEPPPRAIASLQAYVSNLRRLLEPDREPRAPARILVSAPPGYAVRVSAGDVDAWQFEHLLSGAREAAATDPGRSRQLVTHALSLWHGDAFAEVADEPWAALEAARLEELRFAARELQVEVSLRTGAAAEAAATAETLTRQQPLREEGWRLYTLALWASGRQADALAALRRARGILGEELGLDPGPALVELESAILAQRADVLAAATAAPVRPQQPAAVPEPAQQTAVERGAGGPSEAPSLFVGREAELAELRLAARQARAHGPGFALVTGDAGVGKSSLLGQLQTELEADGWLVVTGRCPETEDAPPAWAWTEALRALSTAEPAGDLATAVGALLGDDVGPSSDAATGRFRLHTAVSQWLARAASRRPLAVIIDDLHDADGETLALVNSVATALPDVPALLVTAYRPAEGRPRLTETLAVLARRAPHRISLGGLPESDVRRLLDAVYGGPVDRATVRALSERTGGNPFYVRESARLLASEGALVAVSEVPEGVRDVLRRRVARLPTPAMAVLRLVATVGREAEVDVLVDAADTDADGVLDACEAGLIAGLLDEPAPGRVRFVHALVRDTLYADLSLLRRTRMHARVAEAIHRRHPEDLPALAHHYARAASAQTASLAVEYGVAAARLAERRFASDAEVALLTQALAAFDQVPVSSGPADRDRARVELMGDLLRAQVRAGAVVQARKTRDNAVALAERAERDDLLIAAFTAWSVPTPWLVHGYGTFDESVIRTLTSLLGRAEVDPATRCRLLAALAAELEGSDDPLAVQSSAEAVELARTAGDPELLALALTARLRVSSSDVDASLWEDLGAEIGRLGRDRDLPAYEWYGEYIAARVAAARNDLPRLIEHYERGLKIAREFQMGEPECVSLCTGAMLEQVAGRFDEAEQRFLEATDLMDRLGSPHGASFRAHAVATLRLDQARWGEVQALLETLLPEFPVAADALALVLAHGDEREHERARALLAASPTLGHDYFFTIFMTIRAMAVVALGERARAAALIEELTPYRDQVAGAASTSIAMRPVAHTLGDLYALLGLTEKARDHYAMAVEVASRWGSWAWLSAAEAALQAVANPVARR